MNNSDPFWLYEPSILINENRITEIMPSSDMSTIEKLNSIARLSIYVGILISLYKNDTSFLMYTLIVLGYTIFMDYNNIEEMREYSLGKIDNKLDSNKTLPTPENPFMNVLMTDYTDNPKRKEANILAAEETKEIVEDYFNQGLYKDVSDIFGRRNSQRQFYTMPNTEIPNNQDKFARWLYRSGTTCKENSNYCNRYEDLKYHQGKINI